MFLLVFPADSDVVKVREDGIEIVLFNELHHLALKTSDPICGTKWETCELIEIVTCFEGGVLLVNLNTQNNFIYEDTNLRFHSFTRIWFDYERKNKRT